MLNYGQNPLTPASLQIPKIDNPRAIEMTTTLQERTARAKTYLEAAQQRQKAYADQGRREVHYEVGEDILLSTRNVHLKGPGTPKLMHKWIGPYNIVRKIGDTAYELELPQNLKLHDVFHVSLLKPTAQTALCSRHLLCCVRTVKSSGKSRQSLPIAFAREAEASKGSS